MYLNIKSKEFPPSHLIFLKLDIIPRTPSSFFPLTIPMPIPLRTPSPRTLSRGGKQPRNRPRLIHCVALLEDALNIFANCLSTAIDLPRPPPTVARQRDPIWDWDKDVAGGSSIRRWPSSWLSPKSNRVNGCHGRQLTGPKDQQQWLGQQCLNEHNNDRHLGRWQVWVLHKSIGPLASLVAAL